MARRGPTIEADPRLARLAALLDILRANPRTLAREHLLEIPRLYRYAASRLSGLETSGTDPARAGAVRRLVARAHAALHRGLDRPERGLAARAFTFLMAEVPRTLREEWRILLGAGALLYGTAILSWAAVTHDLDLAWSLLDAQTVAGEIAQLERTPAGEPFRGNFTFGFGESSVISGWILAHNMFVGVLIFGAGMLPPLYAWILLSNGAMLGSYTAIAGHWGRADEISSILWCHGTLELQAIVLAGAAGLALARGVLAPGPWTRAHALTLAGRRAWRLLAPVFPMLFLAGLIEGFVSPHAGVAVRLSVAGLSGLVLALWVALGGRAKYSSSSVSG